MVATVGRKASEKPAELDIVNKSEYELGSHPELMTEDLLSPAGRTSLVPAGPMCEDSACPVLLGRSSLCAPRAQLLP